MDDSLAGSNGVPPLQGSDTATSAHDEVIGLQFTNGHIFYLYRSTLMKSSGYFARRFGGTNVLPPSSDEVRDAMGRRVYFFERTCTIFQEHVLPFILTRKPGKLPPFSGDRTLWRDLRKEAEHFDVHGLLAILYVTHLCPPNDKLGHGILYYIGTNKGTGSNWNSQAIEVVNMRKEAHYMSPNEQASCEPSRE